MDIKKLMILKIWYIHIVVYYSAISRNKLLINTTLWVNLQNIMLKEKCQKESVQKNIYCMIPFTWSSTTSKSMLKEVSTVRNWLERDRRNFFWGDCRVLHPDRDVGLYECMHLSNLLDLWSLLLINYILI